MCILSSRAEWNENPEDPWYDTTEPKDSVPIYRFIAIVVFVAVVLILIGFPLSDPFIFVYVVAIFSVFAIIDALCNRGLVRSLKGKR